MQEIQLGGKLLGVHYSEQLVQDLRRHQVAKMIEYHFRHRGKQIIEVAKNFERNLPFQGLHIIYVVVGKVRIYLPPIKGIPTASDGDSVNNISGRDSMKKFNLEDDAENTVMRHHWDELLKNPQFVINLSVNARANKKSGLLTAADVQFIICCHIDGYYDSRESLEKINKIGSMAFPTEADDFSSFDPPHLRGVLAETVLSQKLAGYALGKEEIVKGAFAVITPLALVDIVSSYYPVDLLNA